MQRTAFWASLGLLWGTVECNESGRIFENQAFMPQYAMFFHIHYIHLVTFSISLGPLQAPACQLLHWPENHRSAVTFEILLPWSKVSHPNENEDRFPLWRWLSSNMFQEVWQTWRFFLLRIVGAEQKGLWLLFVIARDQTKQILHESQDATYPKTIWKFDTLPVDGCQHESTIYDISWLLYCLHFWRM